MRLIYLTVRTPLGSGEEFFLDEMLELINQDIDLLIIPRSPDSRRVVQDRATKLQEFCIFQPLFSLQILLSSIIVLLKHPINVISLFLLIIRKSNSLTHLTKNMLVFPKALWLSQVAIQNKVNHIHAQWASATSTMAMIASNLTGIPWSFTAHRWDIVDNNMFNKKLKSSVFARFISLSGLHLCQSLQREKMPESCKVIHMGIRIPPTSKQKLLDLNEEIILFCPAHLYPVKGHIYLFNALAILIKRNVFCRLILAGFGFLEAELRALTTTLGIGGCVEFVGHLEHAELLNRYSSNSVDIVILPSIELDFGVHEGIPVALMEAMSYGIPVISTTTGGILELLHDEAGILVPPRDSQALADAIESLIQNQELRQQIGEAGRRRVMTDFNVEVTTKQLIELMHPYSNP